MRNCLDSWGVLRTARRGGAGAVIVQGAIDRGRPAMSWANLVEVHYRTTRDHGRADADQVLAELRPRIVGDLPRISAMREVSRLKADNPIALADCFAIALAGEEGALLLTGDPEIFDRAELLPCDVEDLRPATRR